MSRLKKKDSSLKYNTHTEKCTLYQKCVMWWIFTTWMYPWNQDQMTYQRPSLKLFSGSLLGKSNLSSNSIDGFTCLCFLYGIGLCITFVMKDRWLFVFKGKLLFMYLFLFVQITHQRCQRSSSRTGSGSWAASLKLSVPFTTREQGLTTLPQTSLGFGVLWSSS